jgi:CubicO group peptidase (beta-lactamase class C family)
MLRSMLRPTTRQLTRRAAMGYGAGALASGLAGARLPRAAAAQSTPIATPAADPAAIVAIAERAMAEMALRAVLLTVAVDGEELVTHALGESMTGVPATADMHLRNGAVAITYVSTLLLTLVDDGTLALDDTIDRWLPDLPDAGQVTLKMLATMTAGYPDFVPNPDFSAAVYRDPFHAWSADELIGFGLVQPRLFAPGENWDYSHTNYVILGRALEAATGEPLDTLLRERILEPIGLEDTASEQSAWMPEPVLHAFSSERRQFLGIPPAAPFLEESTFWNPSWTLPPGAVQYSTVGDMAASFAAIGRGDLLSDAAMRELLSHELLGFGAPLEGCRSCHTMDEVYLYGLGVVQSGGWMLQNPLFGGYASAAAYHPGARIAIAVATTFTEAGYDDTGGYRFGKSGQAIVTRIGELLLPDDPPLMH